jgi:hypothetical protein
MRRKMTPITTFPRLSSGIAWDESCHCGTSIAKSSLYEVCQLGAKGLPSKSKQKETKGQAAISCTDRKQTDGMEQLGKQQSAAQTGSLLAPAAELRLTKTLSYTNRTTVIILFFTPNLISYSCGKFGGKIIAINP